MKYGKLIIEKGEYNFLKEIIPVASYFKNHVYKSSIEKLNDELSQAELVPEEELPADVVRLNSVVTIKTSFEVERSYQIVTPEQSNIAENKISILAPMGLALFGYAQGDSIEWEFPVGKSAVFITNVRQQGTKAKAPKTYLRNNENIKSTLHTKQGRVLTKSMVRPE